MLENHLKKLSHDYVLRAKRATFIKMFLVGKLKLVKIIFAWLSNTVIVRLAKLTPYAIFLWDLARLIQNTKLKNCREGCFNLEFLRLFFYLKMHLKKALLSQQYNFNLMAIVWKDELYQNWNVQENYVLISLIPLKKKKYSCRSSRKIGHFYERSRSWLEGV